IYLCCVTLLRGKVMLTSPGSCNANSLCHFQRSKMVLFNCGPSHHTQGCLRIAALVSLSYAFLAQACCNRDVQEAGSQCIDKDLSQLKLFVFLF
uniref:Uncharacterized protein n=1 Tax=Neovison vison TaxID=452646 RepID=A0A8C7AYI6_NEOVI